MSATIPVLFGTETGNAEYCADDLSDALNDAGFKAEAIDMESFTPSEISSYPVVFIITSTYGNGDPPANAADMLEYLQNTKPSLEGLRYAVCGLGDSSFTYFAQCGKDFDQALSDCKATSMFERVDCDDDYDVPFERFKDSAVAYIQEHPEALTGAVASAPASSIGNQVPEATSDANIVSRDKPFLAPLVERRLLSKAGSAKETMHYEFDLEGSGIEYRVGDCLGVHPRNSSQAIGEVLAAGGFDGSEAVAWQGESMSLRETLSRACLQSVGVEFVKTLAAMPGAEGGSAAAAVAGGDSTLSAFIREHHVVDALRSQAISGLDATRFTGLLRKTQPRLYSVASSPSKNPNRVAFTVETLRYQWNDRDVEGVATCWFADQVGQGDTAPMYLVKNDDYQFPANDQPVIMVGPGTGIAPFRAYLEEVEAAGLTGDTWLFFGHQHQAKDFLYEEEIRQWQASGVLNKASFAWSRDQAEKVYVQHRIAQNGAELWSWLERGAAVYVCGDAQGMAPDVAKAFCSIATTHGGQADGEAWLAQLTAEGRYKTDVY